MSVSIILGYCQDVEYVRMRRGRGCVSCDTDGREDGHGDEGEERRMSLTSSVKSFYTQSLPQCDVFEQTKVVEDSPDQVYQVTAGVVILVLLPAKDKRLQVMFTVE